MDLPIPHEDVRRRHARFRATKIKRALSGVAEAIKSPRCLVSWRKEDNGDTSAVWVTQECEGEVSVNVSDLKRQMDDLIGQFGPGIAASRKGNPLTLELPTIKG